jgi:hypothetical protein
MILSITYLCVDILMILFRTDLCVGVETNSPFSFRKSAKVRNISLTLKVLKLYIRNTGYFLITRVVNEE